MVAWQAGDVVAGKYRIERVIGTGGMGVVVSARHIRLDEQVAIKLLLPGMAERPGVIERFVREARAASKIKSDHVVRVTDVDVLPSGAPYLVMEYLEGDDLGAYLRARGSLPVEEAAGYLLETCEAIAEAHAIGVVHRDLKPANLFLARRRDGSSRVKVLDFGISKITAGGLADGVVTQAQVMMGSPFYMSPEQIRSTHAVDGRTDIWSLGVILYEMLTGRTPFTGEALDEVCAAVLHAEPARPRALRPDLPPELEAVVLRCLEKDAARRFSSVADLAAALAPFAPATYAALRPLSGAAAGDGRDRTPPGLPVPATARAPRRRLGLALSVLAVVVTTVAMIAIVDLFWPEPRAAPPDLAAPPREPPAAEATSPTPIPIPAQTPSLDAPIPTVTPGTTPPTTTRKREDRPRPSNTPDAGARDPTDPEEDPFGRRRY